MNEFYKREITSRTISVFIEEDSLNKYNFNPPYQREENVWDKELKSFLIDSIMKNFPIPPIFLEQKINQETGKTTYDVVDGKQRLTTIKDFVNDLIKLPDTFGNDEFGYKKMNGKKFSEIKNMAQDDELVKKYIKSFWSYIINVEFIDIRVSGETQIINNIFDRLNRGGERLNANELRRAKYYDAKIYQFIEELRENKYFKMTLETLNKNRLDDVGFITEIYILVATREIIGIEDSSKLDDIFENLIESVTIEKHKEHVNSIYKVINILESLDLDLEKYKIKGVTHQYALWYLAISISDKNNDNNLEKVKGKLNEFYTILRDDSIKDKPKEIIDYKKSTESSTKRKLQRTRRVKALLSYCTDILLDNNKL